MDGDAFRTYVQHVLTPALSLGNVLVLDNLPAHKVAGVQKLTQKRFAANDKGSIDQPHDCGLEFA
ncbi:hypothetical protein HNO88_004301 [Novosphingobium chloroacetimidivorans]|uniref:Tc1-like transposase DDE domain-containing protein n=1 Tax=Novosphingobium chloroacetimidivorans TaxID=1428314 RepID=A0A7W7KEC7_9SPHN|nr:hypothetical protein [Novosphingobium chloroacetimidivorans]MBB4860955.1 hypothetical protein [Novosphingobium chloroacetimidivorans]